MRLARSVLDNAEGLNIFAYIGMTIFVILFVLLIIYVIRMRKSKVDEYSRLPLEEDENGPAQENDLENDNSSAGSPSKGNT